MVTGDFSKNLGFHFGLLLLLLLQNLYSAQIQACSSQRRWCRWASCDQRTSCLSFWQNTYREPSINKLRGWAKNSFKYFYISSGPVSWYSRVMTGSYVTCCVCRLSKGLKIIRHSIWTSWMSYLLHRSSALLLMLAYWTMSLYCCSRSYMHAHSHYGDNFRWTWCLAGCCLDFLSLFISDLRILWG